MWRNLPGWEAIPNWHKYRKLLLWLVDSENRLGVLGRIQAPVIELLVVPQLLLDPVPVRADAGVIHQNAHAVFPLRLRRPQRIRDILRRVRLSGLDINALPVGIVVLQAVTGRNGKPGLGFLPVVRKEQQ